MRSDDEYLLALSACSEFDQPRVSDVRCRRLGGYLLRLFAVRNDLASITKGVPSGMTCTQCVDCSLEGVLGRFFGGLWCVLYASRNACSQPALITLEVEVKVEVGKTPQPTGNQPVTRRKIEMGRRLGPRAGERG